MVRKTFGLSDDSPIDIGHRGIVVRKIVGRSCRCRYRYYYVTGGAESQSQAIKENQNVLSNSKTKSYGSMKLPLDGVDKPWIGN